MKKILILYATAGIGHKKASIAVKKAFEEMVPEGVEVTIADSLELARPFFKKFYLDIYLFMVGKLPTFWGVMYYLTDNKFVHLFVMWLRKFHNWLMSGKLRMHLIDTQPDVIISTHFFASEVIAAMKRSGAIRSRLITVVTDYRLHSWWVNKGTDRYVVGGEEAKGDLIRWGVDASAVDVLGIPVEPVFTKPLDKGMVRRNFGLTDGIPTILVISGGFGVGPIAEIIQATEEIKAPAEILAVCGHNEDLAKRLQAMKGSFRHATQVFGFVQNVYEFMEAADILISKSGGITVSESLAKDLPLVVISPIIGQETRNCDFLISNGAAVRANNVSDLKGILEDLAAHPEKVRSMREAIARIRKPMACYDIAKLAVGMCG